MGGPPSMPARALFCLGGLVAVCAASVAGPSPPRRPHIVYILGDDVGSSDVGYHGQLVADFAVKTPTIDKLAAAGVKLSAHYVRNWCAPTRAMILTGRYELHYAQTGGGGTGHTNGVPLNFTLLPEALQQAGYRTAFLGKWHLGESSLAQTPKARGFDFSLGYFGGQEDYYLHNVGADWPDGNISRAVLPPHMQKTCAADGKCKCDIIDLWTSDLQTQGPAPTNLTGEYSMFFYTRRAVELINSQARLMQSSPDSRLFMYFASQLIHDPHQVPQRFIDLYPPASGAGGCPANQAGSGAGSRLLRAQRHMQAAGCDCCGRRTVMAMMSALDESVLNISTALESTGLMANTLFIFASDNGGVVADHGSNIPLRGGKFSNVSCGWLLYSMIETAISSASASHRAPPSSRGGSREIDASYTCYIRAARRSAARSGKAESVRLPSSAALSCQHQHAAGGTTASSLLVTGASRF